MYRLRGRGFYVVEFVLGVGILVLAGWGIFDRFIEARDAGRRGFERIQARHLAHERLAELMACGRAELRAWSPPPGFEPAPGRENFLRRVILRPASDGSIGVEVQARFVFFDAAGKPVPSQWLEIAEGAR